LTAPVHTGAATRITLATLPGGATQWVVVLSPDPPPPHLPPLPPPFTPHQDDPACAAAYRHPSGLDVLAVKGGTYQVGTACGDTLTEAAVAMVRRLTRSVMDGADACAAAGSAEPMREVRAQIEALADVLDVALGVKT